MPWLDKYPILDYWNIKFLVLKYVDLPRKMLSSKLIANYQHTNEKPLFTILVFSKPEN